MMMDDTKEKERENKEEEEEDKKKSRAIFLSRISLISQNNQSNIITSTFSIKPVQKKAKANFSGMQQKSANANISQSSVISNNTNHKNSLFEEVSVSNNTVINFHHVVDNHQPQKILGSVDDTGSQTRKGKAGDNQTRNNAAIS